MIGGLDKSNLVRRRSSKSPFPDSQRVRTRATHLRVLRNSDRQTLHSSANPSCAASAPALPCPCQFLLESILCCWFSRPVLPLSLNPKWQCCCQGKGRAQIALVRRGAKVFCRLRKFSSVRRSTVVRCPRSTGLEMKCSAPFLIASTPKSRLAFAVRTISGMRISRVLSQVRRSNAVPSPNWESARMILGGDFRISWKDLKRSLTLIT